MAPITITIRGTDLKSVNSMTDDRASKIITSAKKAMINGKTAEVANPTNSSIDVKMSDGTRWRSVDYCANYREGRGRRFTQV